MKRTLVIALIVVCMMFGVVAYATAAGNSVTVSVTPAAVLTLTVPAPVSFVDTDFTGGSAAPGASTSPAGKKTVTVTVKSNKAWILSSSISKTTLPDEDIGLVTDNSTTSQSGAHTAQAGTPITDNYSILNLPWALDAGTAHHSTVTYTATQP